MSATIEKVKTVKPKGFFVPGAKKTEQEKRYQDIVAALKDQMRWPIGERRIFSLSYVHDKKNYRVEVGRREPLENSHEILAILDSNVYLVFTRDQKGGAGPTILVNKDEVTAVEEFLSR